MPNAEKPRVAVVGGGAAGLMAAGYAAENGAVVTLFEHKAKTGMKLGITGKGRCNLTNDCTETEFLEHITVNPRFLYSAVSRFSPKDTIAFFENAGVPLKTERGRRVFPASDKASDIVKSLRAYASRATLVSDHVNRLIVENGQVVGLGTPKREYFFDAVILATGGASYPATGSDGSGYRLARDAGHTLVPLVPSLVPLISPDPFCADVQGVSLKNVKIRVIDANKTVYEDFGEMLFTHFGVSGPLILSASAHLRASDFSDTRLRIDLKPALTDEQLESRLLSDFRENANRDFQNELATLLPQKMILPFAEKIGINPHKKVHDITREERRRLREGLRGLTLPLSGFRPLSEAIVTSGGVKVSEVSPKTMESKLVKRLYFAGEILDVDGYTGGYNLQIAFSTARLAAENAANP
ncbi:MAG: NAD(P)/FAD-dependent oxidoreductase [Clostridia bacterium]|nr:NAD(P)/FAD-dependent oxidoreductase [Clostridia bacterium]MDY6184336.1 NAD(P)/FAD-dependent oxidoreductase [Eubacteriales bacterium]